MTAMVRVAGLLALLLHVIVNVALAQVDPRGALRTIVTPHFRIHFRADQERIARRLETIAETAYGNLSTQLTAPRGRIDLALADNVDASNGFAQVFPNNRVVVYAVPPIASQELRFQDEWLRLVTTHELAHIFHIDRARGIWSLGRHIFGRNPVLFPNQLTPSWVKEGIAVYFETRLTGSGRLESTESRVVMRAAAVDSAIPPLSRWSLSTTRFPQGQIAYAWGSQLIERAAMAGGDQRERGSALLDTAIAPSSVKRFVDGVAAYPIPFLLNARARNAFGSSFSALFRQLRDSLLLNAVRIDTSGDVPWRTIGADGWYADSPRWLGNDTLVWPASNGREVTGLYVANVTRPNDVRRVARRNSLDINVPTAGDRTVFAQTDYDDAYTLRSNLYAGRGAREDKRTDDARLIEPDVRRDGQVVAVELGATTSRLVLVDNAMGAGRPRVRPLIAQPGSVAPPARGAGASADARAATTATLWAEPRWSPDGRYIAAAELLPNGSQRIVVLDTAGTIVRIMAGARAVFASPAWTPTGDRLVWSSDRSGRMQLETAPVTRVEGRVALADTTNWCAIRDDIRNASRVSTAVYQPSVSPDGRSVAALVYRVDGFHVSVAPLDTLGAVVRNGWYAQPETCDGVRGASASASTSMRVAPSASDATIPSPRPVRGYAVLPQLLPRYWFPEIGTGRDGGATYGLSSSASDIFVRHDWFAALRINPRSSEIDGNVRYRYRGLGMPVIDAALQQEWDGTFRIADTSNRFLGTIARRRRFATLTATLSRPRVRFTPSASLGAQYEVRDFSSAVDSLLGASDSPTRRGTRYPSLFAGASITTLRRAGRSIAFEEGYTLSASTTYRWREDVPSLGSWRSVATARAYRPLDLPGYARHVIALRASGGFADNKSATEFTIGGVSGQSAEIVPGLVLGDPARTFQVRGVAPDVQRGTRAVGGGVEYRLPLLALRETPSPFTVYADRLSLTLFSDAARAWCPSVLVNARSVLCEQRGARDGIIASAGVEITLDLAVQYDVPYRLRLGAAAPYARPAGVPGRGAVYVTLGGYF